MGKNSTITALERSPDGGTDFLLSPAATIAIPRRNKDDILRGNWL